MITYSCDVCSKTSEPGLQEVDGMRSVQFGWFFRRGRVPAGHEIVVLCCSKACCKAYDKVEAEKIGFEWAVYRPPVDGDYVDPTKTVKPLKVS